jgi:acetyl-CoA acetyltransferase
VRPVWIAGVGIHAFGRFPDRSLTQLGAHAVRAALAEAGIGRGGFGAAFCGTVYGGVAAGHKVLTSLGLSGIPTVNVEAGCASGGAALALGAAQVASGRHDAVLVFGMEKMPRGIIRSSFFDPWREEAGLAATPAYFALRAQRLMQESDVRLEDLARVSEKNHRHGVHNPEAMYRKALTVEEILASPVVCEPLRLLMLCAPNEGAAAVVLSATPAGPGPVRVAAAALRSHHAGSVLGEHTPLSGLADDGVPTPTEMAARDAYTEAGLGPEDVHVVELQDTDAAREILSAEELGLCPRRGGGRWVREGGGEMTSARPVNPSGGLLSKGEPLGASALAQVVELVSQLRGAAGPRQVRGARVALAHTVGRGANACVIIIATRDFVSGRGGRERGASGGPGERRAAAGEAGAAGVPETHD